MVRRGDTYRLGYGGPGAYGAGGLREFPMNGEEQNRLCPRGDSHVHAHTCIPAHTPAQTHHTHTHVHICIHSSEEQVHEQVQI